jgi:hypothetical protein
MVVTALMIMAMVKMLPVFYAHVAGMYNDSAKTLSANPYDPKNTRSNFTLRTRTKSKTTAEMVEKPHPTDTRKQLRVMQTTTELAGDTTSRTGWEQVGALDKSVFDD